MVDDRSVKIGHLTRDKGHLGVLKAQLDLFEQGFTSFRLERFSEGKDAQERSQDRREFRR